MEDSLYETPHTFYARPIEAMKLTNANLPDAARWCGGRVEADDMPNGGFFVLVPHLDGPFHARTPHWLVRNANGAFEQMVERDFHDIYDINPPRAGGLHAR